jgi:hypothetical protein
MEADRGDCRTKFGAQYLANDFELGQGVNYKIVVLSKISKFVNMDLSYFGLNCKIKGLKGRHLETETEIQSTHPTET